MDWFVVGFRTVLTLIEDIGLLGPLITLVLVKPQVLINLEERLWIPNLILLLKY